MTTVLGEASVTNVLGLIELLLVLSVGIGWAVYELRALRRGRDGANTSASSQFKEPPT